MANFIVCLIFALTSLVTFQSPLDYSSTLETPITSNKVFTEAESRQNTSLLKQNTQTSDGDIKYDFLTSKTFKSQKLNLKLHLKPFTIKSVSFQKLHCIWII